MRGHAHTPGDVGTARHVDELLWAGACTAAGGRRRQGLGVAAGLGRRRTAPLHLRLRDHIACTPVEEGVGVIHGWKRGRCRMHCTGLSDHFDSMSVRHCTRHCLRQ